MMRSDTEEATNLGIDAPQREVSNARSRSNRLALFLVGAIGALPFLSVVQADPDLWWHVRTGRRIIAERGLPSVDDWSFTAAGRDWVNHEWLSDVFMAVAYESAGGSGLLVLRGILFIALVAGLVIAIANRVEHPLAVFVIVMATVPVLGTFINMRAHSFTYALLVWTVVVLDLARRRDLRWLYALPLVMLVWVNLHGGFLLGLGFIGASLLAMLLGLDGIRRLDAAERRTVVGVGIATLAATLVTPFGADLYGYLASELTANHSIVSEWQPVSGSQVPFFWLYFLVPMALYLLARRWRNVTLAVFLAVTALQTWQQARFFVVLGLFAALVAAEAIGHLTRRRIDDRSTSLIHRLTAPAPVLAALASVTVVVLLSTLASLLAGRSGVAVDTAIYPIRATEWLAEEIPAEPANLGLPLRWGGYALWHLPHMQVAIDGRNLTVYDDDWVDAYLRAERDGRVPKLGDSAVADVWMLQADSKLVPTLANSSEWHIAYRDPIAVVLLPGTGEPVQGAPPPATASFP